MRSDRKGCVMVAGTMEGTRTRLLGAALAVIVATLVGLFAFAPSAQAEEVEADVTNGGFSFHLWMGTGGASVALTGYSGSATQIALPTSVKVDSKTSYSVADGTGYFFVNDNAFQNNTTIRQVGVSEGYEYVGPGAFSGCTSLTKVSMSNDVSSIGGGAFAGCTSLAEVVIGDGVHYIGENAFTGNANLKTYRFAGTNVSADSLRSSGIGVNGDGSIYAGVTVYTKQGSAVDEYVKNLNANSTNGNTITLVYENDPYTGHEVKGTNLPLTTDPISLTNATINGVPVNAVYTGKPVIGELTVSICDIELGPNDYTVSYINNVDAGNATVIVTG